MRSFTLLLNFILIALENSNTEVTNGTCGQNKCTYKDCYTKPNIIKSSCFDGMPGRSEHEENDPQKRMEKFWKLTVS